MALGIGFGAERIGLLVLRWPKIAAAVLIALVIVIAASLPNLRFENDIHRAFFSDSEVSRAQLSYRAQQSSDVSTVLVHLQSERAFTAQDMSELRDLALDLEFLEGVKSVVSPFALRFSPSDTAPKGAPVFGTEISDTYGEDLARFRALGTGLPTFLNGSQTALLIGVRVDLNVAEIGTILPELRAEVDAAVAPHISARVTGEEAISHEIVTGLKSDLIRLNLWGSLLVGFAALVLLRDLRMVLLAVIPALLSAASVLALSVWLGHPITVLSNVIPILLLVLGVADGVHLEGHLKATGDSPRETILRIGPACALTAITTALAFTSIMVTRNAQLFDFAVLGGAWDFAGLCNYDFDLRVFGAGHSSQRTFDAEFHGRSCAAFGDVFFAHSKDCDCFGRLRSSAFDLWLPTDQSLVSALSKPPFGQPDGAGK
jgi:predicted RND superfamily exporter protein